MQREYIELGSTPPNEECAQVGDANYRVNAIRECKAHIQAIRNYLGIEPDGADLSYRGFQHDFGTFYETVVYYDPSNQAAADYAMKCEAKGPMTWADGGVKPPAREGSVRVR